MLGSDWRLDGYLEALGADVMTLGVGISYVDAGIQADEGTTDEDLASIHLQEISSIDDNGNPYYYNTDQVSNLEDLFDSMFNTIVNGIPVENVTITDVIDPRFEIVDATNIGQGGTYDRDTGTITWTDVNLPYSDSASGGWTVTFTIKAKDEFMGGNVVPTNGASSGVSGSGDTVLFPQPAVNVKSLGLEVPVLEETVYLGDNVNAVKNVEKIKAVLAKKNNYRYLRW